MASICFRHCPARIIVLLAQILMVKVTGREAHGGHMWVSPHFYNTEEDIDRFIDRLREAKKAGR